MITGMIAVVFVIAMIAAAGDGEWGAFAVGAVVVVVLLALGAAGRESDRAYNNFVDYWANGVQKRKQASARKRESVRNRYVLPETYQEETARHAAVSDRPQGKAVVCHFCGRFAKAQGEYIMTTEGRMFRYRCPSCGQVDMTKVGT